MTALACHLELSGLSADERCGSCEQPAREHRNHRSYITPRATLPVPSYVPATCENVRAAATTSAPTGMFVVVLPPDVLEVGQALHDVLGIFWLNPERDASRWRGKDAIAHACAGCSHALQHMRGRVTDPDTGRPHLHLAGARMLLAVAQLRAGKGGV